ncbi:MAG TPA: MBL fold metallo-hydrolase [Aliidongia sp.]|uniref:MBL fold metallo-hydrolase n=1 Tax=Aliidongia sp. TaxID=1914230 RepID=UPI002DDCA0A1|nr:MBL fold metallo-hydrolase [Aliidongia sp.]HEV2674380.1 MBL fold metallo-hydrolase [Aliidongia sp.]
MRLTFLGTGDAFGSGGRLNTCFHLDRGAASLLIDCGASSMIAIRRAGVDPNAIATILISHLHGDHFGGLPFFILDAQLVSRRTTPLTLVGPPGLAERLDRLMEAMFAGSSKAARKFAVTVVELEPGTPETIDDLTVTGFEVLHPSGAPSLALRLAADDQVIAYTGDTEWVPALIDAGRNADLLIAEAYFYDRPVRFHLDYATLQFHLPEIGAKRVIVTHMSPEMLDRVAELGIDAAEDGLAIEIP